MSTLTISNVCKSYGSTEILKGIDLSLASGEFLVLLGASGSGKSTLLNMIAGLAEPTSGDIRIDERSIVGVHPKDRDTAMVFQSYALYPNLNVKRNIGFGLEMRKVPAAERDKAVLEAARLLQIENLLDRKPAQLSGGQRQRVAIGRALVRHPKLFLFDEPLSNLDAKLRMEMRAELKRLHQLMKTTMVYVTHDQIEAMTLATRIAVMRNGRIEQLDTPENVYNRPATLYVATFVGAPPMNMLEATFSGDRLTIDGTDTSIPIGNLPNIAAGRRILLGVRSEAIGRERKGQSVVLRMKCDIAELTGPELIVTGTVGPQRLVAALPPSHKVQPGEEFEVMLDPANIHLFDAETEQRLN
ncbi:MULTISPECIES: sn-glycerol-3-phosphate ABC transporter ATP-binding protein UgpC [Brucella]|uniref:Glycerol-3-phosphate ABC transporter, ATP-binding protein UgpC (TC 3.A.1.1.3) n=1 Tax=Ochrobactrum soli TaxID=2448455 RepID=A0A2P9HCT2_9HYPH|nr:MULTISPECIES: sn-glycerol-3-phosphate ABC transporter ATP-binding protein UgpC [Brucella]MCI1000475.1 sn-glycerol-3-phosphate ABC transporter ATP-binding protein UgpC [Ochrobactrum sp. C6C9]MDX4071973.1 sn-glycerol-3-phosphate ABC transporter ATP-binding protein UgpC [Brucella sp. NBRC 113783]SPL61909.1 Glycerol-3-phosphate ABC transporter, ATP-binding protein UgpC (TC 3.A.1.1.3) [[Ochrobactrum] soli]